MNRVCSRFTQIVFLVLLFSSLISISYAGMTVVPKDQCDPQNTVFSTYREENSHVSNNGSYDYVFCYEPEYNNDLQKTLVYEGVDAVQTCFGGNEVVFGTGPSNAHAAIPGSAFAHEDYEGYCYGYLSCYRGLPQTNHEFIVAKLSTPSNAHITTADSTSPLFPHYVSCKEPICDVNTYARKTPLHTLYTFDSAVAHHEVDKLRPTDSFGNPTVIDIRSPQNQLAFEAAYVSLSSLEEFVLAPLRISNWSGYDAFEFFVQPIGEADLTQIELILQSEFNGSVKTHKAPLSLFLKSEAIDGEWSRIRIPLSLLTESLDTGAIYKFTLRSVNQQENTDFYLDGMQFVTQDGAEGFAKQFYCARNEDVTEYFWINDLDTNERSCKNTIGSTWTGTRCCGDDYGEFYVDVNGSCFDGDIVEDGIIFDIDDNGKMCQGANCKDYVLESEVNGGTYLEGHHFAFANDKIYVCGNGNVDLLPAQFANNEVVQITLPQNDGDVCSTFGNAFCTKNGYFSTRTHDVENQDEYSETNLGLLYIANGTVPFTNAGLRSKYSKDFDGTGRAACCPQDHCFHDGQCYEDMSDEPAELGILDVDGERQRCIEGQWSDSLTLKTSLDGTETGYCPQETDCLVSTRGSSSNQYLPKCISSGESFNDAYCYSGSFTSRTGAIAQNLLTLAANEDIVDYSLFCDSYDKTLNYFVDGQNPGAANDLRGLLETNLGSTVTSCGINADCVNNFCVFNPKNDPLVVGTSVNYDITNMSVGFGKVFGLECDVNDLNEDGYTECTFAEGFEAASGKWTFYPENNVLLISQEKSLGQQILSFFSSIGQFVVNTFRPFADIDSDIVSSGKLFTRFYSKEGGDVQVAGFTEKLFDPNQVQYVDILYVTYEVSEGNYNVCNIVFDLKDRLDAEAPTDLDCTVTNGDGSKIYTVTSTDPRVEDYWTDLTAKLRVN